MRRTTDHMSRTSHIIRLSGLFAILLMLSACNSDPLSPGIEYMPDMYRSPALEEYVDYGEIKDRINDSLAVLMSARLPVEGTVPYSSDPDGAQFNFPYPYENTPEDYERAGADLKNPIEFTEDVYLEAQAKYEIFCTHCHGETGNGQGILVTNGKFAAPPAYQGIAGLTEGKMFHTLMYGKGNMGSHAGQLSRVDRWKLVHYVQTLIDEKYDNPFEGGQEEEPANEETN